MINPSFVSYIKCKMDGCWRSSTGVSPLRRSAGTPLIACDAFNARTVTVGEYHCPACASSPASCHACFTVRCCSLAQ
ncbi:MAG: hypothetical protein E7430_05745 [Ruminococcaceae bacterium]|nr:hypothetical protein [Oscillospiraceae bacterium]